MIHESRENQLQAATRLFYGDFDYIGQENRRIYTNNIDESNINAIFIEISLCGCSYGKDSLLGRFK